MVTEHSFSDAQKVGKRTILLHEMYDVIRERLPFGRIGSDFTVQRLYSSTIIRERPGLS